MSSLHRSHLATPQKVSDPLRWPFLHSHTHDAPAPAEREAILLGPQPVQQVAGKGLPAGAIPVGVDTPWAHLRQPQRGATHETRAAAVAEYAAWIAGRADLLRAARGQLAGHDLACECPEGPCHRDVLIDIANPPADPLDTGTGLMGLTVNRQVASMLLVEGFLGGKTVVAKTLGTDYRGPVAVFASPRINDRERQNARAAGLAADWHAAQRGWLGTTVLVDVHQVHGHCCTPSAHRLSVDGTPLFHWVFAHPARLALPTHGYGFAGLRPVAWSVLIRRSAPPDSPTRERQIMTDSRARSDEQAIEAVPCAGGAWATNAHVASQVSSGASAGRDTARHDRAVYRIRAVLIVVGIVGITFTILLYLLVYAFAGGFAPTTAVQCRAAGTVWSTSSPPPQALR
jgi:hypothetical protein